MRLIWLIVIFFISYGSLFPFNFDFSRQLPGNWLNWLLNWEQRTIRSDLIANVLLFIPYGFSGALMIQQGARRFPLLAILILLLVGIVFALGLQGLQFFIPSRVPHAADATINSIGILIGISLAAYTNSQRINRLIPKRLRFKLGPTLLLFVLWMAWQLFPYIPILESEQFGKGLLHIFQSVWSLERWWLNIIFWLLFYYCISVIGRKNYRLSVLLALTLFIVVIKLAMLRSHLGWSELSAIPFALAFNQLLNNRAQLWLLAITSVSYLLWLTLYPIQWQTMANSAQWLPFEGFLQGSTWYNLSNLIEQSLLYATLAYSVSRLLGSYQRGMLLLVSLMLLINTAQFFIVNKVPDTTSIVIALMVGLLLQRLAELKKS